MTTERALTNLAKKKLSISVKAEDVRSAFNDAEIKVTDEEMLDFLQSDSFEYFRSELSNEWLERLYDEIAIWKENRDYDEDAER